MRFTSNFESPEIYIIDKKRGINTYLNWNDYNERLLQSKYTMIFPAFDTNVISIDRLIGAIWNDCLPIFHSSCRLDDVEESFDVDLKQLVTNKVFTEEKRMSILEELNKKIIVFYKNFIN